MQRHAYAKTGALVALVLAVLVSIVHLTSTAGAREKVASEAAEPAQNLLAQIPPSLRELCLSFTNGPMTCLTTVRDSADFASHHQGDLATAPGDLYDGLDDAGRHCLWQGYLAVAAGDPGYASDWGYFHEQTNYLAEYDKHPNGDPAAHAMDLHNNDIARRLVQNAGMIHPRLEWLPLSHDEESKLLSLCRAALGRAIHVKPIDDEHSDNGIPVKTLIADEPDRFCELDYRVCSLQDRLVYLTKGAELQPAVTSTPPVLPPSPAPTAQEPTTSPTPHQNTAPQQPAARAPQSGSLPPIGEPRPSITSTVAAPAQTYTVHRLTDGFLAQWTGPGSGQVAGRLPGNGTEVRVVCQTNGPTVDGLPYTLWDRLDTGLYVYDYYLTTPGDAFTPALAHC
ncbi:DUF6973 domain-containing protein [Kitasatospora cheerisanensis]|uniref:DUF6973 domain-containing protein n=1 Tax=Kitasatospora cheerisanensis KCTC 2395 TaxID=1348663 RepID=A0A066YH41_9ACTN|nr:hypothetical protein [Kitasatospora cheerisanensis]KDN80472.1 hypothetical protein KCH_77600 [Kitasatospora cheerisanensis KCTC 2395]